MPLKTGSLSVALAAVLLGFGCSPEKPLSAAAQARPGTQTASPSPRQTPTSSTPAAKPPAPQPKAEQRPPRRFFVPTAAHLQTLRELITDAGGATLDPAKDEQARFVGALVLTFLLLVYLVASLLYPEKF